MVSFAMNLMAFWRGQIKCVKNVNRKNVNKIDCFGKNLYVLLHLIGAFLMACQCRAFWHLTEAKGQRKEM